MNEYLNGTVYRFIPKGQANIQYPAGHTNGQSYVVIGAGGGGGGSNNYQGSGGCGGGAFPFPISPKPVEVPVRDANDRKPDCIASELLTKRLRDW